MPTKTKKKPTGAKEQKKGRVGGGKLKLNKETVKDLKGKKQKGGEAAGPAGSWACNTNGC